MEKTKLLIEANENKQTVVDVLEAASNAKVCCTVFLNKSLDKFQGKIPCLVKWLVKWGPSC